MFYPREEIISLIYDLFYESKLAVGDGNFYHRSSLNNKNIHDLLKIWAIVFSITPYGQTTISAIKLTSLGLRIVRNLE